MTSDTTIVEFNSSSSLDNWYLVNDTVMGGKSDSDFQLNNEGHAVFSGYVTTANNGGFASIRHDCKVENVEQFSEIQLKVKGDGKNYQLRVKKNRSDYYSYIYTFETSGTWETVSIPLEGMYASYRGRTLDKPNFQADQISEIAILIGNKKKESFQLEIDAIKMR
jgi:hypothetical protein